MRLSGGWGWCEAPYGSRTVDPKIQFLGLTGRKGSLAEQKYSPEFKDACVQEVIRNSRTIAQVARENGVVQQTLRNWVNAYKKQHPAVEPELSVSERARLKQLEAEVRELRAENEFLGKATAFFAKKHR